MVGIRGYVDTWIRGYVDTWIRGYVDTWIRGYVDTWIRGYVDTWIRGYVDTWIRGYVDTWIHIPFFLPTTHPPPPPSLPLPNALAHSHSSLLSLGSTLVHCDESKRRSRYRAKKCDKSKQYPEWLNLVVSLAVFYLEKEPQYEHGTEHRKTAALAAFEQNMLEKNRARLHE